MTNTFLTSEEVAELTAKLLMKEGWAKATLRNGDTAWVYPGDMRPWLIKEACEITVNAYPDKYTQPKQPSEQKP